MARCPCSCELPGKKKWKKKDSPRLTLQREIGRKHIFNIVSVYMWGSQGRKVRNGKLRNGNISKTSCFFHHLKGALPHTNLPRWLSFSLGFFFQEYFSLPVTQTKDYVFICLFCAPHHFTEHHIWSVSPREALLPSPTAPSLAPLAQQRAHIKKTSS